MAEKAIGGTPTKLSDPATHWTAVTPSDTALVALADGTPARAFYVNTTGDMVLEDWSGNTVTFQGVPSGTFVPCAARRVKVGTTASLVALY